MEKPKKLKLKRKKQVEDSIDRKPEQNIIHHANDTESNAESTTVISDSDNELSDKEKNPPQKYENTEIYLSKNRYTSLILFRGFKVTTLSASCELVMCLTADPGVVSLIPARSYMWGLIIRSGESRKHVIVNYGVNAR